MSDEPAFLDDFRVMSGLGRVVLQLIAIRDVDETTIVEPVRVGMSPTQARELAADLVDRAERAETRSRRPG